LGPLEELAEEVVEAEAQRPEEELVASERNPIAWCPSDMTPARLPATVQVHGSIEIERLVQNHSSTNITMQTIDKMGDEICRFP
jgi:hypothetical protein